MGVSPPTNQEEHPLDHPLLHQALYLGHQGQDGGCAKACGKDVISRSIGQFWQGFSFVYHGTKTQLVVPRMAMGYLAKSCL